MEKGARVKVVRGRKVPIGTVGTVFWVGDNPYGDGQRLGIEGDDGETYWTAGKNCEVTEEEAPEIEPPEKGARVAFEEDGEAHEGEVFWSGPAKSGNGFRVGVRCDDGETRWVDARKCTLAADPAEEDEPPPF
ncbi:MAG: hypothetical protein H6734_09780 [Alphaproteobacteria bacterium]|nr:hypothetical protein [Alphaproteobacteria bacterium]